MQKKGNLRIRIVVILIAILLMTVTYKFIANEIKELKSLQISQVTEEVKQDNIEAANTENTVEPEKENVKENTVELNKKNLKYKTKKDNTVVISEYEGLEDCITIPKEIDGKKIEKIEKDAFNQCYNLETIIVPVELEDVVAKIEHFEVNKENSNDEYIELSTTREYSEVYKAYMQLSDEVKENALFTPYKFEVMASEESSYEVSASSSSSSYDLRDYIEVQVENQGSHGTCYAYATFSSLETWIAKNRGELVDFSEVHAGVYSNAAGGLFTDVKSYINSSDGPVWEVDWDKDKLKDQLSESDYNLINNYLKGTDYSDSDINHMKNVLKTDQIQGEIDSKSYLMPSNDTVKEHITTYGALVAYYHHDSAYLDTNYNGYTVYNYNKYKNYLTATIAGKMPDHAVCIIGWDDNFSKYNFPANIRPESNGAFLVLNSWGENWGTDGGCFWVSYEDPWLAGHEAIGVTGATGFGDDITLNIINANTGSKIEEVNNMKNIVNKGAYIEVVINANVSSVILRNPNEGINETLTVSSKNGKNVVYIDTKTFKEGVDYILDIKYNGTLISKSIRIRDYYDYEIKDDGTIKLTSYNMENFTDVVIPKKYDGYTVSELGSKLLYNDNTIETITVYDTVKTIGTNFAPSGVIIFGNTGSTIEAYSKNNNHQFVKIGTEDIEGDFWNFNIPTKTLYITGKMSDYYYSNAPWAKFNRNIYIVNLSEDIKEIGSYAFYNCYNLVETTSLKNISVIDVSAFQNCYNLSDIGVLTNIEEIGNNAFYKCSSIEKIGNNLSKLKTIGNKAFYQCEKLSYLRMLGNLTSIGKQAFYGCASLYWVENISILKTIGEEAFVGCTNLEYVLDLNNVETIGKKAFYQCSNLKSIGHLENIVNIEVGAFYGCTKLYTKMNMLKVKNIGDQAFSGCTALEEVKTSKTLQIIGANVFSGCDNLTIYGISNTKAENYAKTNNIPFVYLNISKIEIKQEPDKVKYIKGENLELTSGRIFVTYESGFIEEILMTDEAVTITGYDANILGEQEITVTYKGAVATFKVKVTNEVVEMRARLDKTIYIKGEELDLTSGKIRVKFEDGSNETVNLPNAAVTATGYDPTLLGEQEITLSYKEGTCTVKVTVTNDITNIQIGKMPSKTTYIKGEKLELTDGTIIATYQDKTQEEVSMADERVEVAGYDATKVGEYNVSLKYNGFTITFVAKVTNDVTGIAIKEFPNKTRYILGEELDLTGGKLTITYQDKTTSETAMTHEDVVVNGYNANLLGKQFLNIKYKGVVYSGIGRQVIVTVTNNITDMEIINLPTKTAYIKGEPLILEEGKLLIRYEDNTTEEILMTDKQLKITGYDANLLEEQEITVTYEGYTATFKVEVTNDIVGIEIKEEPTKTTYVKGEALNLEVGKIVVKYEDGTTKDILMITEDVEVTGYDANLLGEQEITVTYEGYTATFKVEVTNDIVGIEIKEEPTKTTYVKGEALNLEGGKIVVKYEDGTAKEILMGAEDVKVTGYDANILGEQEITITYEEHTAKFKVKVTNDIVGIEIKEGPTKITYVKGEALNLEGGKIVVKYEDGTAKEILMGAEDVKVTGYDANILGEQEITITYEEHTAKFKVKVTNDIVGIKIKEEPTKTTYLKGEALNLDGGKIVVKYEDKTTQEILMTDKEIKVNGYDNSLLGEQIVELQYLEYRAELKIMVISKVIVDTDGFAENIKLGITENENVEENKNSMNLTLESDGNNILLITGKVEYSENILDIEVNAKNGWEMMYDKVTGIFIAQKTESAEGEEFGEIVYTVEDNGNKNASITIDNVNFGTVDNEMVKGNDISKDFIVEISKDETEDSDKGDKEDNKENEDEKPNDDNKEDTQEKPDEDKNEKPPKDEDKENVEDSKEDNKENTEEKPKDDDTNNKTQKILKNIKITKKPNKKTYEAGETFDTTGLVVTAEYSDGTKAKIKNYIYTPMGALKEGENRIFISYVEEDIAKVVYYDITVDKKESVDNTQNNNKPNTNTNINNNTNVNNKAEIKTENSFIDDLLNQIGIFKYVFIGIIVLISGTLIVCISIRHKKE